MAGIVRLEPKLFRTDDPREVAASLKRSADAAARPDKLRLAMMLLAYALQRRGQADPDQAVRIRHELFRLYGKPVPSAGPPKAAARKKTRAK